MILRDSPYPRELAPEIPRRRPVWVLAGWGSIWLLVGGVLAGVGMQFAWTTLEIAGYLMAGGGAQSIALAPQAATVTEENEVHQSAMGVLPALSGGVAALLHHYFPVTWDSELGGFILLIPLILVQLLLVAWPAIFSLNLLHRDVQTRTMEGL